ncbi:hypothetical protein BDR05DRAFT_978652 [Suillus weaverae]|nr:hypothetical protein BDR05DRAFT_978652 [Suillus weaverae]
MAHYTPWQQKIDRLKARRLLTLLLDGWEDKLRQSLYGSLAAEVKQHPIILALEDMTGKAMKAMEIGDARKIIAVTTDNPTFQNKYYWVLTVACFLHSMNTLLGEIFLHGPMKKILSKTTRIVSFFNSSHYWGGQLNDEAKKVGVTHKLKQNCETHFYALILQCLSPKKKINGQTPIAADVTKTVIRTPDYWNYLDQMVRTAKFIVDAIGNIENRDCNLAECMLELICDDMEFFIHAKSVFNHQFHSINTKYHTIALFLHPICPSGRPFKFMVKWKWNKVKANALIMDLKAYNLCHAPFAGSQADGLAWWENLPINSDTHPLKSFAIIILSIVPHAAEVEQLFSDLGGTQSAKCCNLSVGTFEALGKICIDTEVAKQLKTDFTFIPPLAAVSGDTLEGPESISLDDIDTEFA